MTLARQPADLAVVFNHIMLQKLAGPVLDKIYNKTTKQVDEKLAKQTIGVQIGTDGWKRKNVNEAQKIQNFIANFPDGTTHLRTFKRQTHETFKEACAARGLLDDDKMLDKMLAGAITPNAPTVAPHLCTAAALG